MDANGCFSVLLDHECQPAVRYLFKDGNKSQAMPGSSCSKSSLATIGEDSFIIISSPSLYTKPGTLLSSVGFNLLKDNNACKV